MRKFLKNTRIARLVFYKCVNEHYFSFVFFLISDINTSKYFVFFHLSMMTSSFQNLEDRPHTEKA